jgi:hypothetical protein
LSTDIFYVYEHWRPDEGVIFYVGKGQKRRAWDAHRGRNRWHKFIFAKLKAMGIKHEVRIVQKEMSERAAFDKEVELIAYWRAQGADLVNITDGGDGPSGRKHTEEWKQANSLRMKGRKPSEETRAKMSAAAMGNKKGLGKKRPQWAIDATANAQRGVPKSEEHRRKCSIANSLNPPFLGKHHTPGAIAKIREKQVGVPKKEWVKERMRGIPKSAEHRQKLREFNLGKTHTAETRAKLSEKSRADWARRKAEKAAANLALPLGNGE